MNPLNESSKKDTRLAQALVSNDSEKLLPISEAASLTPYSSEYLSLRARKGKLPAWKIDGVWYTTKSAVLDYMQRQMLQSKAKSQTIVENISKVQTIVPAKEIISADTAASAIAVRNAVIDVASAALPAVSTIAHAAPPVPLVKKKAVRKFFAPDTFTLATLAIAGVLLLGVAAPKIAAMIPSTQTQVASAYAANAFSAGFSKIRDSVVDGLYGFIFPGSARSVNRLAETNTRGAAISTSTPQKRFIEIGDLEIIRQNLRQELASSIPKIAPVSGGTTVYQSKPVNLEEIRYTTVIRNVYQTISKQSESDVDMLSEAIGNIRNNGEFDSSTITNATITGSTFAGPLADVTGLIFGTATGTSATTTNLYSTNASFGSLITGNQTITGLLFTNATGTSATTTSFFSTTASSTNLFATGANFGTLIFGAATGTSATTTSFFSTNAVATNATTTNLYSAVASFGNLITGNQTITDLLFVNATGTSATTTNFFSTTASSTNLFTTSANIGFISFGNATGSAATTTNFFSTKLNSTNFFATNADIASAVISNSTTTNATTTNLFSTTASSTNLFSTNANIALATLGRSTTTNATSTTSFSTTASSTNLFSTTANLGTATIGNATTTSLAITGLTAGSVPFIGTGGTVSQNNSQLFWDNNQTYLGLGITTPSEKLHVSGGVALFNAASIGVGAGVTSGLRIAAPIGSSHYNWQIGAQQNVAGGFEITPSTATGGTSFSTPAFVVKADTGNVGIGNTNPQAKLDVAGSSIFGTHDGTNFLNIERYHSTVPFGIIRAGSTDNNVQVGLGFQTRGSDGSAIDALSIVGSGNVGIGTTDPLQKLDVSGNIVLNSNKLYLSTGNDATWTLGREGTPSGALINTVAAAVLKIYGQTANQGFMIRNDLGTSLFEMQGTDGKAYFAGNVGIGTTTPNQKLSIFNNGADAAIEFSTISGANEKWTIGIDDSDAAKFKIASSSALGTSDRLTIDGNGNFSIAGRQSNFGTDFAPINLGASGGGYPAVAYNVNFTSSSNSYAYRGNDAAFLMQLGLGGDRISFYTAPSGTAGNTITFSEVLSFKPFDIDAKASTTISTSQSGKTTLGDSRMLRLLNTSGGSGERAEIGLGYSNAGSLQPVVLGHLVTEVGDVTKGSFYIATRDVTTNTAPTERLTVTSAGNVGIGSTTPSTLLSVTGTANVQQLGSITSSGSGIAYNYMRVYSTGGDAIFGVTNSTGGTGLTNGLPYATVVGSNNNTALQFATNVAARMTIDTSGNVGIGTTTPQQTLVVGGTGNTVAEIAGIGVPGLKIRDYSASGRDWRVEQSRTATGEFDITDCTGGSCSTKLSINSTTGLTVVGAGGSGVGGILAIADGAAAPYTGGMSALSPSGIVLYAARYLVSANGANNANHRLIGLNTSNIVDIDPDGRGASFGSTINVGSQNGYSIDSVQVLKRDSTTVYLNHISGNAALMAGGTASYLQGDTLLFRSSSGATEYGRFSSAGNLGIGTTNPLYRLDVLGPSVSAAAGSSDVLRLQQGSDGGVNVLFSNNTGQLASLTASTTSTGAGTDDGVLIFGTSVNGTVAERMRITSAGNVGIGTTTPTGNLHVYGTGNTALTVDRSSATQAAQVNLSQGGTTRWALVDRDSGALGGGQTRRFDIFDVVGGAARLSIDNSGNLGIGTTSPFTTLGVTGTAYVTGKTTASFIAANGQINANVPNQTMMDFVGSNIGRISVFGTDASTQGTLWLRVASSDGSLSTNAAVLTSTLATLSGGLTMNGAFANTSSSNSYFTGNLGIGTTNPGSLLDVLQTSTLTYASTTIATSNARLFTQNNSATNNQYSALRLAADGNNGSNSAVANLVAIQPTYTSPATDFAIQLRKSDSSFAEQFRVTSSGNVGIGTTTPANSFVVAASGKNGGDLEVDTTNNTIYLGRLGGVVSDNSTVIYRGRDGTRSFVLDYPNAKAYFAGGITSVGIGTTTPTGILTLKGSSGSTNFMSFMNDSTNNEIMRLTDCGTGIDSGVISVKDGGTTKVNLVGDDDSGSCGFSYFNAGFVGFGMTNPSVALDVTGDIEYTGTITDVSDSRLKENVANLTNALDVFRSIRPTSFNMIGSTKLDYGFIAQEVQLVLPDVVHVVDPETGHLGISYVDFIPFLAQGIKELDLLQASTTASLAFLTSAFNDQSLVVNQMQADIAALMLSASTTLSRVEAAEIRVSTLEALISSTTAFSISTTSPEFVSGVLAAVGAAVSDNWTRFTKLAADTFRVGSAENPTGITLYDAANGSPYCLRIWNGASVTSPGECSGVIDLTQNPGNTQTQPSPEESTASSTPATDTASSTPQTDISPETDTATTTPSVDIVSSATSTNPTP